MRGSLAMGKAQKASLRNGLCTGLRRKIRQTFLGIGSGRDLHFHLLLFSRLVVSDSLLPRVLQKARRPCPSLSPGVCSNS